MDEFVKNLAELIGLHEGLCDCNDKNCCNKNNGETCCKGKCECENKNSIAPECAEKREYYKRSKYCNGKKISEWEKETVNGETIKESNYVRPLEDERAADNLSEAAQDNLIRVTPEEMNNFVNKVNFIENKFNEYDTLIEKLEKRNSNLVKKCDYYHESLEECYNKIDNFRKDLDVLIASYFD